MAKLTEVEGIGEVYAKKLADIELLKPEDLLEKGSTPAGRKEIAEKTGISSNLILEWVNHVDLFRVRGIGEEYADLLEEAGVDTVPELAQRDPESLLKKISEVNAEKLLVRRLPGINQVRRWVEHAKQLPRKINY